MGDEKVFKKYPQYQKDWIKDRAMFKHNSNLRLLNKKKINYLDMNICDKNDGWDKLCPFLDKSIPSRNFPFRNKSE